MKNLKEFTMKKMKHLQEFHLFENENIQKPQTLKELKKLMRQVSNDRGGEKTGFNGLWREFSLNMETHRGNFMFAPNPSMWDDKGEMTYTGSGSPDIYIDSINKRFFNPLGWEMIDLGQRSVKVQKLK